MYRTSIRLVAAVFTAFLTTYASAQSFHEACAYDIGFYCSDVAPGDGRIAACLYAHTDTLTDSCFAATDNSARILEAVFDLLQETKAACAADVQEFCSSEKIGGGRMLQCLKSTEGVSEQCTSKIENLPLPAKQDQ